MRTRRNNLSAPVATLRVALIFTCFLIFFGSMRLIFILANGGTYDAPDILLSLIHGIPMDCTVAGYLSVIPALIIFLTPLKQTRYLKEINNNTSIEKFLLKPKSLIIYFAVISLLLGLIFSTDLYLFDYWQFRIDSTPLFYFTTSPSAAMASVTTGQLLQGILVCLTLSVLIFLLVCFAATLPRKQHRSSLKVNIPVLIVVLAILFIAIRGGLTVSTMNPGRVYYSDNAISNQAALNPVFTLLYSATHREHFDKQFQYYSPEEANALVAQLDIPSSDLTPDNLTPDSVLGTSYTESGERPDIFIIILESFSDGLFPSLGGEPVASGLDSLSSQGLSWNNCYASGFRTDRGIPAILSGFPAPPTVSVMKQVQKAAKLPNIARELTSQAGYSCTYYYGGDADFTNMRAYLRNGGFKRIVCDADFPVSERLSKWGVHDDVLFRLIVHEMKTSADSPRLSVIQTSSSHEPFEVPYYNPRYTNIPEANAFAFTDSVVSAFIREVRSTDKGRNTLFIITADHWGAWPGHTDIFTRHRIPLIILQPGYIKDTVASSQLIATFDAPASQTDIPATLLSLLGLNAGHFPFSHNLLSPNRIPFAWMCERNEVGLIMEISGKTSCYAYNIESNQTVISENNALPLDMERLARAYLQYLYMTLAGL